MYRLVQTGVAWTWSKQENDAFTKLKSLLSTDTVLAHFDASVPIGIACDTSNVGIEATLFHRYPHGSERPIANVSKTLSKSQRNYSQIQKEALAIIFALKKILPVSIWQKIHLGDGPQTIDCNVRSVQRDPESSRESSCSVGVVFELVRVRH